MQEAVVYLTDEPFIALCDLLKVAGLCDSGGQAKQAIASRAVWRNGTVETRKTAKIRAGEWVEFADACLMVVDGYPEDE